MSDADIDTNTAAVEKWCQQRGMLLTDPPQEPHEVKLIRALVAERDALKAKLADLPWRAKDIRRGLILFRTSSNAHGFTNYSALSGKIDALPDAAKAELAAIMTNMALGFSRDDVRQNGVIRQWLAEARNAALEEAAQVLEREAQEWRSHNEPKCALALKSEAKTIRALAGEESE